MALEAHDKQHIALVQLETALRLFAEGQDFYSVLTLAGAADTILGNLLASRGGVTALASLTRAAAAIHISAGGDPVTEAAFRDRANFPRNALKHLDAGSPQSVDLDIRQEASDMLDRAVTNYWALNGTLTDAMMQFERVRRAT